MVKKLLGSHQSYFWAIVEKNLIQVNVKVLVSIVLTFLYQLSLAGIHITFTDYIIFEGDTLILSNRPLDPYFELYPELMPVPNEPFVHANNQYNAIYEIKDSALYLTAIYTDKVDSKKNPKNLITEVFSGSNEVLMDWLSTTLVFGTQTLGGSKRIYGNQKDEGFMLAEINDGRVTCIKPDKAKRLKRLRHQLFKEFSKTDVCAALLEKTFGPNNDQKSKELEKHLGNRVFDYSSQVNEEKTPHK